MSLIRIRYVRAVIGLGVCLTWMMPALAALAQSISTTTVQGTVYLANGSPGAGTLQIRWPAFTTASNQTVAAGKITTSIGADGFVSVNLAPNLGSSPAGLYYTAVYNMSDGSTSTEYWVVPAAAQATIAQVRSQVMPAAQAVQAVTKAYVDQAIQSVAQGNLTSTGGQLTGPLYLTGDPTQALQAADKHYVDSSFAQALPLTGGAATGPVTATQLGAAVQVDQLPGSDFGAKLQACLAAISNTYGGTCDARNFSGTLSMGSSLVISTANTTVLLPCATISSASQILVSAGTRNVSLRGCALRGASNASGSQGGTVLLYSGAGAAIQVGDTTYANDTLGFHLDDVVINTTGSTAAGTQAFAAYRTQELDLESVYLLGNPNQTGMTLDGTGNYTGGTFYDNHVSGFKTAINGIGHQVTNSAATDWMNASTFVRLHIDCPTANGNPISGTFGVNLQQGDGNSFTGGDVENCGTAVHLGLNAQNNTIVGLRNENSTWQIVADPGSSYNSWVTGGTMFTGKLADNGTRNSFLDSFHRSFNSLNGDWYGSQQDATVTNHFRLGIGNGNERGLLNRYQTDYGYRWTMGLSDAAGGEQFYQLLDELNSVYRISVGQYNSGQASTNNQTVINSAGTGAVVLNGSNNAGTGGVVFGSGGSAETTVATVSNSGNAQFNGALQVGSTAQSAGTMTVRNNADAEVDYYLWPGLTASQKGSFTYKDYNGNSQWYMVKDSSNNWALNSAVGGLDSFKAYQSTNSGDTYINAANSSGVVRVNYESGSGSAFNIYGGNSGALYASFSGSSAIKMPGLSASSGHNCLQIDSSGYITNTGAACATGGGSGTVNSGSTGQIAYYNSNGTAVSGMNAVPVASGGTGATTAAAALAALNGISAVNTAAQSLAGPLNASVNSQFNVQIFGAKGDCVTDDTAAFNSAQSAALTFFFKAAHGSTPALYLPKPPGGCYIINDWDWQGLPLEGQPSGMNQTGFLNVPLRSSPGHDIIRKADPTLTSGTATFYPGWSIRNVGFIVDNSVAPVVTVSGNAVNANRLPGRSFDDLGCTSGSNVIATVSGMVTPGDVGEPIQLNGCGPSGTNLVTTIASVTPSWVDPAVSWQKVTIATNASTTVTNGHGYISVLNLPVTTTIGNCAIAQDLKDGNSANWIGNDSLGGWGKFENVTFTTTNGSSPSSPNNYPCAILEQGSPWLYGVDAHNIQVNGTYFGIAQIPTVLNSKYQPSSGDVESWVHGFFNANVTPWLSYNGLGQHLEDLQLTGYAGPQVLQDGNIWGDTADSWKITGMGFESPNGNNGFGWRITGLQHNVSVAMTSGASGQLGYFDANSSTCNDCGMVNTTVNGYGNNIMLLNAPQGLAVPGPDNQVLYTYNSSPANEIPSNYPVTAVPYKGSNNIAGRFTSDWLVDGNTVPYNHDDNFVWPTDVSFAPGYLTTYGFASYNSVIVPDSTSPTGYYIDMVPGIYFNSTSQQRAAGQTSGFVVGTNLPDNGVRVTLSASCPSGTSTFTPFWGNTGASHVSQTFSCTTSYQTYSMNLSYIAGDLGVGQQFSNAGSGTFHVAWFNVQPYTTLNGIGTTGSGAAITTGPTSAVLAHSPACFTSASNGQLEDASGNGQYGCTVQPTSGSALWTLKGTAHAYYTADKGISADVGGMILNLSGTRYWIDGMPDSTSWAIQDSKNSHDIVSFPSNTMPANSLSGNANGATALTQSTSDNSTNIATDAYVQANFTAKMPLSGTTGSIGGAALAAGACTSGTVSIPGATTAMAVVASPTTYPGDGMAWRPYVSAAGTVTVKVCADVAGTPAASTYNVRVIP